MSASTSTPTASDDINEDLLDSADAQEEVGPGEDVEMQSEEESEDGDEEEITLVNNSIGHFDKHTDSIFSIAIHPKNPSLVATGGGDDVAYVFDTSRAEPVSGILPVSYESDPKRAQPRESLEPIFKVTGHTDSVNALEFSLPDGRYLLSGGLDGQLRVYQLSAALDPRSQPTFAYHGSTKEVPEISWIQACPSTNHPNVVALGASDGSIWIYQLSSTDTPLEILQVYYLHQGASTAGAWSPSGSLLCTVAEDSSFYVWDPFSDAQALGAKPVGGSQALIGFSGQDGRFADLNGLFSVAVAPSGTLAAVGGGNGMVHIISLPRLSTVSAAPRNPSKGGKAAKTNAPSSITSGGQVLKTLHIHSDSVESLAFSNDVSHLLASASTDGSIAIMDTGKDFAIKRHTENAHSGYAVVKVQFAASQQTPHADRNMQLTQSSAAIASPASAWTLASCGLDGKLRTWNTQGSQRDFEGHRSGEGGGVLGFVRNEQKGRFTTAGDDGVALVFLANP